MISGREVVSHCAFYVLYLCICCCFFFYNLHNSPSKQKPRANTGIMPELENLADSNTQQQQQPEGAGGRPRMSESVSEERSASRSPSIGE